MFGGRFFTSIMPPPKRWGGKLQFSGKIGANFEKTSFSGKNTSFSKFAPILPIFGPNFGISRPIMGGASEIFTNFPHPRWGGALSKKKFAPHLGGGIAKNWSKFFECHQNATNLGGNFCLLTQLHFGGGKVISVPPPIFGGGNHTYGGLLGILARVRAP